MSAATESGPFFHGTRADLAVGVGSPHVYQVEPTGAFEDDPNVTDKKFPGNPTRSYRSSEPLRVIAEVHDWTRLTPESVDSASGASPSKHAGREHAMTTHEPAFRFRLRARK